MVQEVTVNRLQPAGAVPGAGHPGRHPYRSGAGNKGDVEGRRFTKVGPEAGLSRVKLRGAGWRGKPRMLQPLLRTPENGWIVVASHGVLRSRPQRTA